MEKPENLEKIDKQRESLSQPYDQIKDTSSELLETVLDEKKSRKGAFEITNILNFLLFASTATLALLGFLQWTTMRENIRQTQELVKFTKIQADASKKAAEAAFQSANAANKSTLLAEKVAAMAREDFLSDRSAIWNASINKIGGLTLISYNDHVKLLEALIFYIDLDYLNSKQLLGEIYESKKNIPKLSNALVLPPSHDIYIKPILYTCGERIYENEIKIRGEVWGGKSVSYFPIPIIISSSYLVKGSSFKNTSLYRLLVRYHLRPNDSEKYSFEYLGLQFVRNINKGADKKAILEKEWRNAFENPAYLSSFPKETSINNRWKNNLKKK